MVPSFPARLLCLISGRWNPRVRREASSGIEGNGAVQAAQSCRMGQGWCKHEEASLRQQSFTLQLPAVNFGDDELEDIPRSSLDPGWHRLDP